MSKITVFISSPYTLGDVALNVREQMTTADKLINMGFAPFVPLYTHFQHMVYPQPYETWLSLDFVWVEKCDCLLRLEGESKGADREVEKAYELEKQVFYSIGELVKYYQV